MFVCLFCIKAGLTEHMLHIFLFELDSDSNADLKLRHFDTSTAQIAFKKCCHWACGDATLDERHSHMLMLDVSTGKITVKFNKRTH